MNCLRTFKKLTSHSHILEIIDVLCDFFSPGEHHAQIVNDQANGNTVKDYVGATPKRNKLSHHHGSTELVDKSTND